MKTFNIIRMETSDQGTFGMLYEGTENLGIYTGELPWQHNVKNYSCIPTGSYVVTPTSFKGGLAWRVHNVKDRAGILIHKGNFCGKSPEYKTDVRGCILLGHKFSTLQNQKAVIESASAFEEFNELTRDKSYRRESFNLNIFEGEI